MDEDLSEKKKPLPQIGEKVPEQTDTTEQPSEPIAAVGQEKKDSGMQRVDFSQEEQVEETQESNDSEPIDSEGLITPPKLESESESVVKSEQASDSNEVEHEQLAPVEPPELSEPQPPEQSRVDSTPEASEEPTQSDSEDFSDLPGDSLVSSTLEEPPAPPTPKLLKEEINEEQLPVNNDQPKSAEASKEHVPLSNQIQPETAPEAVEPETRDQEPTQIESQPTEPEVNNSEQTTPPKSTNQMAPEPEKSLETTPTQTKEMQEVKPPEDLKELVSSDEEARDLIDDSKPRYLQFHEQARRSDFKASTSKQQPTAQSKPGNQQPVTPRQLTTEQRVSRAIELHKSNRTQEGFFSKLFAPIKRKLGFN